MRKIWILSSLLVLAFAGTACSGSTSVAVRGQAGVASADLVLVSPGVYVVENHPSAVFYADGYYWRLRGSTWYRSQYYNTGFVTVRTTIVPTEVRTIRRPSRYAHYRGKNAAKRRKARRKARRKDRREAQRERRKDRREARRERRKDRREAKRERRKDRREAQRERRKDKREARRERRKNRKHRRGYN